MSDERVMAVCSRLEEVFRQIAATRMAGVPILNPALSVEATGAREWQGQFAAVLVTPWFMNLMVLPLQADDAFHPAARQGDTVKLALPGGTFSGLLGEEPELGRYVAVSFFSPVFEFPDQATAIATADAILTEIMADAPENGEALAETSNWDRVMNPEAAKARAEAEAAALQQKMAEKQAEDGVDPKRRKLFGMRQEPVVEQG